MTDTVTMDIASLSGTIAHLSLSWIALIVVALVGALDGYQTGASRTTAAALAFLLASLCTPLLVASAMIGGVIASAPQSGVIALVILFILFFILIRRLTESFGYGVAGALSALLGGVGFAAVVCAVWIATPSLMALAPLGAPLDALFTESVRIYWLLGGLAALSFARG